MSERRLRQAVLTLSAAARPARGAEVMCRVKRGTLRSGDDVIMEE